MRISLVSLMLPIALLPASLAFAAGSDDLQPPEQRDFWDGAEAIAKRWFPLRAEDQTAAAVAPEREQEWAAYLRGHRNARDWVCSAEQDISETPLLPNSPYTLSCSLHTVPCRNAHGTSWRTERFIVRLHLSAPVRKKAPARLYRGDIVKFSGALDRAEPTQLTDCGLGVDADVSVNSLELLREFSP